MCLATNTWQTHTSTSERHTLWYDSLNNIVSFDLVFCTGLNSIGEHLFLTSDLHKKKNLIISYLGLCPCSRKWPFLHRINSSLFTHSPPDCFEGSQSNWHFKARLWLPNTTALWQYSSMLNLDGLFDVAKCHSYVNWHLTTQNKVSHLWRKHP